MAPPLAPPNSIKNKYGHGLLTNWVMKFIMKAMPAEDKGEKRNLDFTLENDCV